jgi:hypothetical protein
MKKVIYNGKSATGRMVPFEGQSFTCLKGVETELPDALADQLLKSPDWAEPTPAKAPKEKV